tara:strand:- start:984 stop:1679 length:696 start_codon:yes stop_codon:yes gene_type:complete
MPHQKKTQTTNKKGNKKKQNQKKMKQELEQKEEQEFQKRFGWANDTELDENTQYTKKLTIELFHYFNKNMIIGDLAEVKTKQFLQKMYRKNPEAVCGTIMWEGKEYVCLKEYMEQWFVRLNELVKGITKEQQANDVRTIMNQLLFNPPKPNGELHNWSIGFMGSIWIDCKVEDREYRLALYNNRTKNFGGEFNPTLMLMDMNEDEDWRMGCDYFTGDGVRRVVGEDVDGSD